MSRRCSDGLMITVKTELLAPSKKKLNLEGIVTLPRTMNLDKG